MSLHPALDDLSSQSGSSRDFLDLLCSRPYNRVADKSKTHFLPLPHVRTAQHGVLMLLEAGRLIETLYEQCPSGCSFLSSCFLAGVGDYQLMALLFLRASPVIIFIISKPI
jgi:hypothetical protein